LILAVHGRRDYLVLQIINGTIKFTVDNGKGALSSSFTKDPYDLCDGQWHTIQGETNLNVNPTALKLDLIFKLERRRTWSPYQWTTLSPCPALEAPGQHGRTPTARYTLVVTRILAANRV